MKLEVPVVVNRSREGWDIYISYNNELGTQDLISEDLVIGSLDMIICFFLNED